MRPLTSEHDFSTFPAVQDGVVAQNPCHAGGPSWSSVSSSVARVHLQHHTSSTDMHLLRLAKEEAGCPLEVF